MKTQFEEIVDVTAIGEPKNPIKIPELLYKANLENLKPSAKDNKRVLLLCIDFQNDFMETHGALGVPNSHIDIRNVTAWIY